MGFVARKPVFRCLRTTQVQTSLRIIICIICKLATGEISFFQLVSVAEETGLELVLLEAPDRFSHGEAHILFMCIALLL